MIQFMVFGKRRKLRKIFFYFMLLTLKLVAKNDDKIVTDIMPGSKSRLGSPLLDQEFIKCPNFAAIPVHFESRCMVFS